MKITFAGQDIAVGPQEGGADAVTGFVPRGSQTLQWGEFIRAVDDTPFARLNRRQTLNGSIMLPEEDSLQDAMVARGLMFQSLPTSGALIVRTLDRQLTYAHAVLQEFETLENAKGVAVGFRVTFAVGACAETALAIATENGLLFKTEDGKQIIS